MSGILTKEDLVWLDTIMSSIATEDAERLSTADVSVTAPMGTPDVQTCRTEALRSIQKEAHSQNFVVLEVMGKCKLSKKTRKAEERRLRKQASKRKEYKLKSRKHWKQKEKTRKEYNNRLWERDPLSRIKYTFRAGCDITPEEWERKVAPVWNKYDRKNVKISRLGDGRLTIHNMVLTYHAPRERYSRKVPKPEVIYYGPDEAVYDAMSELYIKEE